MEKLKKSYAPTDPVRSWNDLVPEDLERLLFDDIPYLKTAKIEHDMFAEIMRGQGVEVVYLEDLTADVLKNPEKKGAVCPGIYCRGRCFGSESP